LEKSDWTVGIFIAIMNGDKILILERPDGKGHNLPGGKLEFGNDSGLVFAGKRELFEETGLIVDDKRDKVKFVGTFLSEKLMDLAILFTVDYSKEMGEPVTTEESKSFCFVDRETLDKEIQLVSQQFPGHKFGRMQQMCYAALDFKE
jgi:8-oxo-dGTP pyrophosphatase MutT (NUDIX family)